MEDIKPQFEPQELLFHSPGWKGQDYLLHQSGVRRLDAQNTTNVFSDKVLCKGVSGLLRRKTERNPLHTQPTTASKISAWSAGKNREQTKCRIIPTSTENTMT